MSYCTEIEFRNSSYGQKIINQIKENYSRPNRPILDNYFTTAFLNSYAAQYGKSFPCYQDALEYWANDRYNALATDAEANQAIKDYEKWLEDNKSPLEVITSLLKSVPFLIAGYFLVKIITDK